MQNSDKYPIVSIVMPVHGNPQFLDATIESIFQQTFRNFEVLVILDRASHSVSANAENLAKIDSRFKVIESPSKGIVSALNLGISRSISRYIARIDADDLMSPSRLEFQIDFLENNPEILCVGSQMRFIDNDSKVVGHTNYPLESSEICNRLKYTNCVGHPSVTFRKDAYYSVGGYRQSLEGAEDYDLWLRICQHGQIRNLDKYLTSYRVNENQFTVKNASKVNRASVLARCLNLTSEKNQNQVLEELNKGKTITAFGFLKSDYINLSNYRYLVVTALFHRILLLQKKENSSIFVTKLNQLGTIFFCSIISPKFTFDILKSTLKFRSKNYEK